MHVHMIAGFECLTGSLCRCRQAEIKRGALSLFRFRPYAAAVFGNDLFDDGEAHAGAFKLFFAVQALEHLEQLFPILCIKSYAIIADEEDGLADILKTAYLDAGVTGMAGILHCIGNEVAPYLPDGIGIPGHGWQGVQLPVDAAAVEAAV